MVRIREEAIAAKAGTHYDPHALKAWIADRSKTRIAHFDREVSDPDFIVLVAESEAGLIGYGIAVPSKNELQALYVRPNPVGGVGRALLAELEAAAFEAAPFLICDASLNAEKFYQVNGYRAERPRKQAEELGKVVSTIVRMRKYRPGGPA